MFKEIEKFAEDDAVLSSSSSCIPASRFTENLQRRNQSLVAHPVSTKCIIIKEFRRGSGSLFDPVLTLWGGGHIDCLVWR